MPITDLTGYTWEGKDYGISLPFGKGAEPENYSLNFRSNNTDYTSISLNPMGFPTVFSEENITYGSTIVYETTDRWKNYAYKTIQITGGTDATNSTLIAWLEANGTLTAPIQANTYNLTHTLTNLTKGNITLQITPDTNYTYPTSLTISNGTIVSYDNTTGIAVISGDDTTIVSGECVEQASGYEVQITFQNGLDTSYWDNTKIYDDYSLSSSYPQLITDENNKIGEILSANGTTTVRTTTGKIAIKSLNKGGVTGGTGTVNVSSGITALGYTSTQNHYGELTSGSGLYYTFSVEADGTITIDGAAWID